MSMMVKNLIKEKRGMISAIAAVVILYIVLECFGITCPIKFITGVSCAGVESAADGELFSCAGCGMSRAWLACLRLDFKKAFYYHPLFIFPPCMVCVFLMRNKINAVIYKVFIGFVLLLFCAVYLYRMIVGNNDIVVFEPQHNIIFQILKIIKK